MSKTNKPIMDPKTIRQGGSTPLSQQTNIGADYGTTDAIYPPSNQNPTTYRNLPNITTGRLQEYGLGSSSKEETK